jgi:S1-C subfamily serine protease
LKPGDTIVKFDDRPLDTVEDLTAALRAAKVGQKVKLTVLRGEAKQPIELEATLAERK